MCSFYTIDFDYLKYLKTFDEKVPNFEYEDHDKFFFGVVLEVNGKKYYVPVSSKKVKNATSIPMKEYTSSKKEKARILGSLRLAYMIPVEEEELVRLDMKWISLTKGENYANLVAKEYEFCKNNLERIQRRAKRVYGFGSDPTSDYYRDCCKFMELEKGLESWKTKKNVKTEEPDTETKKSE